MKSFFKTLFASTIGVIIGFTIIGIFSIFIIVGILSASQSSTYTLKDKTILMLDLNGTLSERENDSPFNSILGESSIGLNDMLKAIEKAKSTDEIKGIYIKAGNLDAGIASLEPVRKALIDFKTSGKFVVSYADNYNQGTYYLSSVADKVLLNPKGTVDFHGLASIPIFVRGMYEKMGVKYQVYKVGTYKSAVEPYIQDKMSDANRLQVSSFLNDIWSHMLTGISESRNISVDNLNKYADECLTFAEADTILKYNMVDSLLYRIDLDKYLKSLTETEEDKDLNLATITNIADLAKSDKPAGKDEIAVLYAEGAIVDDGMTSNPLLGDNTISPKVYVEELKKLRDDDDVKAVVFRVNSPGGSAYASEQIWNAVLEVKKKKPIIVSMGDYAASGGYYISCGATSIIAEPTTLTGSIGIFGLIPEGEELAKKMGVTFDEVKTNKHSAFGGRAFGIPFVVSALSRQMNPEESNLIQKYIEKGYDLFITRCADGRSKTKAEIDSIGQGRVWTGKQALELGLVDKLGSINDAIALAAKEAKTESYKTKEYPAQKDFFTELLSSSFGGATSKMAKTFIGEQEYQNRITMENIKASDVRVAIMSEKISY